MKHRPITHLRHVDLAVPDFEKQVDFYTNTWGLTEVANDNGVSFLAAEGSPEQYVIRIRRSEEKRLDLVSWGAHDPAGVDALAEKLIAGGVKIVSDPGALDTPGGGYGFRFFDVDGHCIEVSADVATRQHRKIEEREAIPVKLSHFVKNSQDIARTRAFYEQFLGFDWRDSLTSPHMGEMMYFMGCNPWHHSLAIAKGPHYSMHHVSFEMRGLEEWLRGAGRVKRSGAKFVWGPGRHNAGDNTFAYFLDPHGNTVEYTTELEVVDEDTWHPSEHDISQPVTQDQWGLADPMSEVIAKESFNSPDPLFQAPPL